MGFIPLQVNCLLSTTITLYILTLRSKLYQIARLITTGLTNILAEFSSFYPSVESVPAAQLALILSQTVLGQLAVLLIQRSCRVAETIGHKGHYGVMFEVYYDFRTLSGQSLSTGSGRHEELLGCTESAAVQEHRQVDDVSHVVMSVDVGVSQHTVEVLVDGFYDDMRVAGKDGDERALREENPHLKRQKMGR